MPEKNQFKDANPLKKKEKHQNLCIFTHLYPLLLECVDLRKSSKN